MKRFAINIGIVATLGLGVALVLSWARGGGRKAAVAAPALSAGGTSVVEGPRAEGQIEAPSAPTAELHVCPSGCAYSSIQDAVDAADDGDVIKVATGIYTGVQGRPAPAGYAGPSIITQVVYISKTMTIRGGYTTTNWTASDPEANPTILDAQGQGRVLYIAAPAPGAGISPAIEGLRITGGDSAELGGGEWNREAGSGIYVISATVTLSRCRIVANTGNRFIPYGGDGGGVYLRNSPNAVLAGNTIQGNTTWYGGGVYLHASDNVTLSGNTIRGNAAHGWYGASGGGVLLKDSGNTMLIGNTIQNNTAQVGGGVFSVGSGNATLRGNTIISNADGGSHTFFEGGGISLWDSGSATLSGNTIQGNSSEEAGGICLKDSDNVTLSGNTIRGNRGGYGVMMHFSDNVMLDNNVIADNQTWWSGGGICVVGSTAYLRHITLARNGDGAGLYVTDGWEGGAHSTVALTNTVLVSHTVGITVAGGSTATLNSVLWYENETNTGGPGTLTVTHQITGSPAFAADGYHITPASAALDTGADAGVRMDIDGEPRPAGAGYDIGADEFPAALSVTKQVGPEPVQAGAQLTYTISAINTGSVDLYASITDTLPLSVTLSETSGGTLALPGGTIVLPNGTVAVTWTAVITAPGGTWKGTVLVTVDDGYVGPLTNLVVVTTKEGASGAASVTVYAGETIYLPVVTRNFP
jgi:uncharacterized repeat protein (TIGR01451 family)